VTRIRAIVLSIFLVAVVAAAVLGYTWIGGVTAKSTGGVGELVVP